MEEIISRLETKITIYSLIGWLFVILAIIPLGKVANDVFILNKDWPEDDLGSFLGGVSGSFAALAGVFFVFVAFLGQRISIIQQQIEIQNNIQELRDTREEIRGQKEQLELQNLHFKNQLFESTFFNLLTVYKTSLTTNNRASWQVDLDRKLNSLLQPMEPDGSGGWVPSGPLKTFDEISISVIQEAIMSFPFDLILAFRDAIEPVISILLHIQHKENTHHFTTLLHSIPNRDKSIFIYYFIAQKDQLKEVEITLVSKLLLMFPIEVFKSRNHRDWIEQV